MSYAQLIGSATLPETIAAAPLETDRFGFQVGRLHLGRTEEVEPEQIAARVARSGLDVVVVRYPAAASTWFARLRTEGYHLIHADTLVYYRRSLVPPPSPLAGYTTRVATERDLPTIASLVTDMFDGYGNHYLSNPLFRRSETLAGYVEWAEHYVCAGGGRAGVMLEDTGDGSIVGLATVETGPPGEIALAGLASEHRGRGRYPALLQAAGLHLAAAGCTEMLISTQIHNVRAIRGWSSSGFAFDSAFQTVHFVRAELLGRTSRDAEPATREARR